MSNCAPPYNKQPALLPRAVGAQATLAYPEVPGSGNVDEAFAADAGTRWEVLK
jgi:hypothetical protein